MKKWIFLIGILSSVIQVFSQTDLGSVGPSRIIAPNPEAARFAAYGQYHVSPYTGKPGISIPVYTIKTPRFEMPVTLDYEATGVKVNDLASWVGTGWMLNAGGVITRVVVGLPDEGNGGFLSQTIPTSPPNDNNFYANVCYYHSAETEPDKYYFNFNGKSGDFTYDANKQIFQTVANGLKITNLGNGFEIVDDEGNIYDFTAAEYTVATVNGDNTYMPFSPSSWWLTKMTSADGQDVINFTYESDSQEEEYQSTYSETYGHDISLIEGTGPNPGGNSIAESNMALDINSAVMTRSWDPMRLRSISFRNGRLDFNRVNDRLDGGSSRLSSVDIYNNVNGTYTKLRSVQLLTDYFHYSGSYWNSQIYYTQTTGKYRLKLTGIQNLDPQGNIVGKYGFDYDLSSELPFRGSLQQDYWGYFNGAIVNDLKHTTIPAQPTDDFQQTAGGADREPHENYMKAGVLTKVIYPTGGYSVFDWEAQKYQFSGTTIVTNTPGMAALGINAPYTENTFTVTEGDVNAFVTVNVNVASFPGPAYNDPNHPNWDDSTTDARPSVYIVDMASGNVIFMYHQTTFPAAYYQVTGLPLLPGTYKIITECYVNASNATTSCTVTWHSTVKTVDIRTAGGLRVATISNYNYDNSLVNKETYMYGENESGYGDLAVSPLAMNTLSYNKEFDYWWSPGQAACGAASVIKKVYKSEPVAALALASGSSVVYNVVTKYTGDAQNNAGKTIYRFLPQTEVQVSGAAPNVTGEYTTTRYSWRTPVIQDQEEYKNNGGVYTLVKDTHNEYTELSLGLVTVIKVGFTNENIMLSCYPTTQIVDQCYFSNYGVGKGILQLTASTVKEYDQNGMFTMQTDKTYTYDDQYHCYQISESVTNSKNQVLQAVNKYPFNKSLISGLSTTASQAIDRMMAKNMLKPVVEAQRFRDANLMQTRRTNYRIWDAAQDIVQPENVQIQTGAGPLESRLSFGDYDAKGNLLQQSKTADILMSYVWDYNKGYPIAEVKNAGDQDIAYTSFEADGTGGWNISSGWSGAVEPTSPTGKKCFDMGSDRRISKDGLNSNLTYKISYWVKNPGRPLGISNGTSYITPLSTTKGGSRNGWTYYEQRISGVTFIQFVGSVLIDELRLYPANAQMTTYTYDPLVGMTSQTDAGNRTTYYEYDDLARLKRIRDQDYNILKTFEYQYQAQGGCGSGCAILTMQTFAGTSTLGYPVGVFNVHGNLLGNATSPDQYVSLWNNDTADAALGTLAKGGDVLHFNITLNAGKTPPAGVTGCRYYQWDIPWTNIDGVRASNGTYVDFGDGIGMHLPKTDKDTPAVMPPKTDRFGFFDQWDQIWWYRHFYSDSSMKTITIYHNDGTEISGWDNASIPATSLTKVRNFRGNIPQNIPTIDGSSYQQASALTVQNIINWNSISSVKTFGAGSGDRGYSTSLHMNYAQDFMKNNAGLKVISTTYPSYTNSGYRDTTFKITRLKSDWNTYFKQLQEVDISDEHWNREDLSGLLHLTTFVLVAGNQNHSNDLTNNPIVPIPSSVIDGVINQIAAGSGQVNSNGLIYILSGGTARTSASDASVSMLKSKGWSIYLDGTQL